MPPNDDGVLLPIHAGKAVYVGLFHYIRFFAFDEHQPFELNVNMPEKVVLNYKLDAEKIINILEPSRIILMKVCNAVYGKAHYCICHVSDDYITMEDIVNMFIMKWEDFEKYCGWLFPIVFALYDSIDTQHYDSYQKCAPAFMAERFMSVYVRRNKILAKYFNVYWYDEKNEKKIAVWKIPHLFADCLRTLKNNAAMFILNLSLNPIRRLFKMWC